jgi:hypothetical protein
MWRGGCRSNSLRQARLQCARAGVSGVKRWPSSKCADSYKWIGWTGLNTNSGLIDKFMAADVR